jgi:predicted enzyme related to lactoylglutathione lyase
VDVADPVAERSQLSGQGLVRAYVEAGQTVVDDAGEPAREVARVCDRPAVLPGVEEHQPVAMLDDVGVDGPRLGPLLGRRQPQVGVLPGRADVLGSDLHRAGAENRHPRDRVVPIASRAMPALPPGRSLISDQTNGRHIMEWKLELVAVPVSDVDRAKAFYTERAGFNADHDHRVGDDIRFVQLTPPGSACSIALGTGIVDAPPGSAKGLQLVVSDVHAARAELAERGVDVSDVQEFPWGSFVFFSDPDGNGWAVQQIPPRA